MITLKTDPNSKIIELGGGANPLVRPNVDVRMCYDQAGNPTVDFTADFDDILPIQSNEWDAVFSRFVLEHLSWRKVRQFLSEVFRILKPGGKAVLVTANTEAQIRWIEKQDFKSFGEEFDRFSCILFGDNDYPENTHRNYLSPEIVFVLLQDAGFYSIVTRPYGDVQTDMIIEAVKPSGGDVNETPNLNDLVNNKPDLVDIKAKFEKSFFGPREPAKILTTPTMTREEMFDKHYFNGGGKVGGYAREGYWDYPVHEITAQHVLARKPTSVLELGAARGYILKRIEDTGIRCAGLEISKHCYLTRVCDTVFNWDICKFPWATKDWAFDLCYSIAVLEHIPEEYIDDVIKEMKRVSDRGLHGIDFGEKDDGFDKTHTLLRSKEWWIDLFKKHDYPCEVVNKEELEKGNFPAHVLQGDGKVKLNLGSFSTMYHHGWINMDIHDLNGFAQQNGYRFQQHDLRNGIPYQTGTVDLIMLCHSLEHFSYEDGLKLLRECRRVIKPTGCVRIIVPNTALLNQLYLSEGPSSLFVQSHGVTSLGDYDEINDGCAALPTLAGKLWSLLHSGHSAAYDYETLAEVAKNAGFNPYYAKFREGVNKQILRESLDVLPCLSLYTDLLPKVV